jgi:MFS family permease
MFLLGLGMGAVFMPLTVASFATISTEDMGQASTLGSVISQLSMALAPALVATLLITNTSPAEHIAPASAYHTVYLVLTVMAFVSVLFTLTIRDAPARHNPPPPSHGSRGPRGRARTAKDTAAPGPSGG